MSNKELKLWQPPMPSAGFPSENRKSLINRTAPKYDTAPPPLPRGYGFPPFTAAAAAAPPARAAAAYPEIPSAGFPSENRKSLINRTAPKYDTAPPPLPRGYGFPSSTAAAAAGPVPQINSRALVAEYYPPIGKANPEKHHVGPYTGQPLLGSTYPKGGPGKYKGGARHKKRKTKRRNTHRRKSRKH